MRTLIRQGCVLKLTRIIFAAMLMLCAMSSGAKDALQQVEIADPFIELHTGPGEAYPIFFVIDRGEPIVILLRKTDWFKVKAPNQYEGWVHSSQLEKTLTPEGEQVQLIELSEDDFEQRRREVSLLAGDFQGAPSMGFSLGYVFNQNLSTEFAFTQAVGEYSSHTVFNINLLSHGKPLWRIKPFFVLGGGYIKTEPHATLVQVKDRSDYAAHVGAGFQTHLGERFALRLEYNNYVVFSSDDKNEDPEEWKLGFVAFFR